MQQVSHVMGCVTMYVANILIAGVDYIPLMRNVTLSPFKAAENLAVDIIQDNIVEQIEEFGIRIIIPIETQQLGVLLGTPSEITIRIVDDDCKLLYLIMCNCIAVRTYSYVPV